MTLPRNSVYNKVKKRPKHQTAAILMFPLRPVNSRDGIIWYIKQRQLILKNSFPAATSESLPGIMRSTRLYQ
jgi:hypothetical protein